MARTSLVKQIYDLSASQLKTKKSLKEAAELIKKLIRRKRFTREELIKLERPLRDIRLALLLNADEKTFLEVSRISREVLRKRV